MASNVRRVLAALGGLVAVTVYGVVGYMILGYAFVDALYQTVMTLTTVGYGEVHEPSTVQKLFSISLMVLGVGIALYSLTVIVGTLYDGHVRHFYERRRMDKRIAGMNGHVIICGHGRVGKSAREHLLATGQQVVVVDTDPERVEHLEDPYIIGDCTRDEVLRAAGIERARALIATLETDADTVYLTLSARALRPDLVIISRARTVDSKAKLVLAGATRAVNPQLIGGRRIAAFALNAHVAEFLDVVMHDSELDFRIEQVRILADSPLRGRTLGELDLENDTGARLLAYRPGPRQPFQPHPGADTVLAPGSILIAFGTMGQIQRLEGLAAMHVKLEAGQTSSALTVE
ncbi:MAG TPA: NAD-binding protein [Dermatophilaceae bacterium]|nr:NAD-binding protein [Dermatophilaceae bacterium]